MVLSAKPHDPSRHTTAARVHRAAEAHEVHHWRSVLPGKEQHTQRVPWEDLVKDLHSKFRCRIWFHK
eukprot:gene29290-29421_t